MNTNRLIASTVALSLLAAGGCVGSIGSIGNIGGGTITNGGNGAPASNNTQQAPQPAQGNATGDQANPVPQPVPPTTPATPTATEPLPTASNTLKGVVENDEGVPLDGATVRVTASSFDQTVTTALGTYVLNNPPVGFTVQITVTKSGYTTRTMTKVIASGTNQADFTGGQYAISDKPEIVGYSSVGGGSGGMELTFSEPVKTDSVENGFRMGLASATDITTSNGDTLKAFYNKSADNGTSAALVNSSAYYLSKNHVWFAWNSDHTKVTIGANPGYLLPSDQDTSRRPNWAIVFVGGISDNDNNERTTNVFRSNLDFGNEENDKKPRFGLFIDSCCMFPPALRSSDQPGVQSIDVLNASGGAGDRILVKFTAPMVTYANSGALGTGTTLPGSSKPGCVLNKGLFSIDVGNSGNFITFGSGTAIGTALNDGGNTSVYLDPNDASHQTVVIAFTDGDGAFNVGNNVKVRVSTTVVDPSGNTLNPDAAETSGTAS